MVLEMSTTFVALCVLSVVYARCPEPNELPVKGTDKFVCARVYTQTHVNPFLACSGAHVNIYNEDVNAHLWSSIEDRIKALVVRPGCTLFVHEYGNFGGNSKAFTGKNSLLGGWSNVISSYTCYCEVSNKALKCKPREEYSVMKQCRNNSNGTMSCAHEVAKGMVMGNSVTRGESVSNTVSVSMGATFEGVFSLGLSASTTTTFDWSRTDSETFSKVTKTTVTCSVLPGQTLKMQQVVGRCGDTNIYTGFYECTAVKS